MKVWIKRGKLRLKKSRLFSTQRATKRVFYPGCSLPGADPEFCMKLYGKLLEQDPDLGLWFECCAKSFRLRKDHLFAEKNEQNLLTSMLNAGVEEVITACGNCFEQLNSFAADKLRITMIYDVLDGFDNVAASDGWTIHHPCFARKNTQQHAGVFRLTDQYGISLKNRNQQGHPLSCCLYNTSKAQQQRSALKQERLLTYCAHCVMSFQSDIPTRHLLQELLGSNKDWTAPGRIGLFANYRRFCTLSKKIPSRR